ncbi:MAG: ImmA/IrrE family metallo-endopeptidase [Chthoniobacteraceae bacterium]
MISRLRAKEIQSLAREKLTEYKRMHLPVSPQDFARQLEILVQPFTPSGEDISGFLMRVGESFGIGYTTAIRSQGFQNFTVAHELGHYFIDGHGTALLASGAHYSRSGFISKDSFEVEADIFATELLMPWILIEPLIRTSAGGFSTIKAIADACQSSLVASAIRYAEITKECVAVVVSHMGQIEFMTASDAFKQIKGINWLKKKDLLPMGTASHRFAGDTKWIQSCDVVEIKCQLFEWFPETDRRTVEEEVVGLGSYGRLLTVLVTEDDECEDDDDETGSDDYIDRWKHGFFRGKK